MGNLSAQSMQHKEFILLITGDTLINEIVKIDPSYVKVKSVNLAKYTKTRKIPADSIINLYSSEFPFLFESHFLKIKNKDKKYLYGRIENREIIGYSDIQSMATSDSQGNSTVPRYYVSNIIRFFRHQGEVGDYFHENNKKELLSIENLECLLIMKKLIDGLSEWESDSIVAYSDLIMRYNNECEAFKRMQQDEKSK